MEFVLGGRLSFGCVEFKTFRYFRGYVVGVDRYLVWSGGLRCGLGWEFGVVRNVC